VLIPTAGLFGQLARAVKQLRRTDEIPALNTTFCPPWHTAIFSVSGMDELLDAQQRVASLVAQGGFSVFGARWPLVLNHLFIYRAKAP
jgi:hypothetical protein